MEVLSIPIALILLSGLWFIIFPKVFKRSVEPKKEGWPSATKRKELDFLLSVDDDIKLN